MTKVAYVLLFYVLAQLGVSAVQADPNCKGAWESEMADTAPPGEGGLYMRYAPRDWRKLNISGDNALPDPGQPCLVFRIGGGDLLQANPGVLVAKVARFYSQDHETTDVKQSVHLYRNAFPPRRVWEGDIFRKNYDNYHRIFTSNLNLRNRFHQKVQTSGEAHRTDDPALRPSYLFSSGEQLSNQTVIMMHYVRTETAKPTDIDFFFGRSEPSVGILVEIVNIEGMASEPVTTDYEFSRMQ